MSHYRTVGLGVGVIVGARLSRLGVRRGDDRSSPGAADPAFETLAVIIDAPREVVFDVLSEPYLGRQPRAIAEKFRILERGEDMVLAEHRTPIGSRLVAVTVETVAFTRPSRVDFRVTRGPVPHVVETFELSTEHGRTVRESAGELGTDLGPVGMWWGNRVARPWERVVANTFDAVKAEAERRHGRQRR